jgi:GNAT superfamily N-acetyltransferase
MRRVRWTRLGCVEGISIRTATMADHDAVRGVRRRASLSNEGDRENLLANPETLEYDSAPLVEGRTRVATVDGGIVGFTTTSGDDQLELDALFVDPGSMRSGVGRALIQDLVASAGGRGIARIDVTANDHALAFYEDVGFVRNGVAITRFGVAPRLALDIDVG